MSALYNSSYYFKDNILYPRIPEISNQINYTLISNFSKTDSALNKLVITNPERSKSVAKTLEFGAKGGHGGHDGHHGGHGGHHDGHGGHHDGHGGHHDGHGGHGGHHDGHYDDYDHHAKYKHKGHGFGHKGCVGGHKTKKHGGGYSKSKYMMPAVVGLMTAKAILLPLVLKSLAFMSAKGLFLGLLATIMATILSLKKMVEPVQKYEKKDDTKIEIVPIPIQDKYHHYSKKDYEYEGDSRNHPYNYYY